jgi:hypothetical protein
MGDEEGEVKVYVYEGARAAGEMTDVTAGEEPKVLTKPMELLGPRHGEGVATFPDGSTFQGSFDSGMRSGHGTYSYAAAPAGEEEEAGPPLGSYEGSWKNGQKEGVGVMTWASGAKYHGAFGAGKFEGQGTMFYPNGDIYTGEWAGGKKHGAGTYIFKESGTKMEGNWVANVLQSGTFSDKFGNQFTGDYQTSETNETSYVAGGVFSLASGASAVSC